MPAARSIDEVLLTLTAMLRICRDEGSRLGYFAALYRRVTERVKADIAAGRFEDGARMERLDVTFANRYIEAWDAWRAGRGMTACWRVAFEAAGRPEPVILQHLLSGMNAHINLDLAIAAAATCPGAEVENLKTDFDQINQVLAELVDQIESELAAVCPLIGTVTKYGGETDNCLINFDIRSARGIAWGHARRLAALQGNGLKLELALAIKALDAAVTVAGELILHPGPQCEAALLLVRAQEESDVVKVIAALA